MPQLVLPDQKYKQSYIEAVKEYQAENLHRYRMLDIEKLHADFAAHIHKLRDEASGVNLPEGHLPHTEYWLVEDGEFIGRVDVRHALDDHLRSVGGHVGYDIRPSRRRQGYGTLALRLALEKAKGLGLDRVLVTCDVDNLASNKIIKANGGVLEDVRAVGSGKPDKCRYWITIS